MNINGQEKITTNKVDADRNNNRLTVTLEEN